MKNEYIKKIAKFILYNIGTDNIKNLNWWMLNEEKEEIIKEAYILEKAEEKANMEYEGGKGILNV